MRKPPACKILLRRIKSCTFAGALEEALLHSKDRAVSLPREYTPITNSTHDFLDTTA